MRNDKGGMGLLHLPVRVGCVHHGKDGGGEKVEGG